MAGKQVVMDTQKADYEKHLYNIEHKNVTNVTNLHSTSVIGLFSNYFYYFIALFPKFNIHTERSKINTVKPFVGKGKSAELFKETGIQTKSKSVSNIDKVEVIEAKLLSPNAKIRKQEAGRKSSKDELATNIVEKKPAVIPNSRPDIESLVSPRFIESSHSCVGELESFVPTSERHKSMTAAPMSNEMRTDCKKISLNIADDNSDKLSMLVQNMLRDVINFAHNVNSTSNSQVSIKGLSVKLSIDIKPSKQVVKASTELKDKSSISEQLAIKLKESLPAIANKQELNITETTSLEKPTEDVNLYGDELLSVEEEDMSSMADVLSDGGQISDIATFSVVSVAAESGYGISTCDLSCKDELYKQGLKTMEKASVEKRAHIETLYDDELLADDVEEEDVMSNIPDGVCSDDTLTGENETSTLDFTFNDEWNQQESKVIDIIELKETSKQLPIKLKECLPTVAINQELKTIETASMEIRAEDEMIYDDELLADDVEEEEVLSSMPDVVYSDDTLTGENGISTLDLTFNDEWNQQELKITETKELEDTTSSISIQFPIKLKEGMTAIVINQGLKTIETTSLKKGPQDEMFYDDELLAIEEEEFMPKRADRVYSVNTLIAENGISIFDLTCNNEWNKQELKILKTTSTEQLPHEILYDDDQLPDDVEGEVISKIPDGVYSEVVFIGETGTSIFDFTCNDELHNQEIKTIATNGQDKVPNIKILLDDDELLADDVDKENVMSSMAGSLYLNDTLTEENVISVPDLTCIDDLSAKDEKKLLTFTLNDEFEEMATTESINKLIGIECNDEVKHYKAFKLTEEKITTLDEKSQGHNSLKMKISVSKHCSVSDNLLKMLCALNCTSNHGLLKFSAMVPALYFHTWFFQNLGQGYLLYILLRKANLNTFSYMRNLYFVIIRNGSQKITIILNYTLKNEIFVNCIKPKPLLYILDDCCKNIVSLDKVQQIFPVESKVFELDIIYSESNSNNSIIQSQTEVTSIYSGLLAEKRNASTSYLYLNQCDKTQIIDVGVGESKNEFQSDSNICDRYKSRCKTWFTGMLNVPKSEMGKFLLYDVNETVFEQFSVDRYMEAISCKSNSNSFCVAGKSKFYNIFFKCLGHTIACTILSVFISML